MVLHKLLVKLKYFLIFTDYLVIFEEYFEEYFCTFFLWFNELYTPTHKSKSKKYKVDNKNSEKHKNTNMVRCNKYNIQVATIGLNKK